VVLLLFWDIADRFLDAARRRRRRHHRQSPNPRVLEGGS
jgi:hypothetical protein